MTPSSIESLQLVHQRTLAPALPLDWLRAGVP